MIALNALPITAAGISDGPRLRHRKFGVCEVAGRSLICGSEFMSLAFANGSIHFPMARSEALLADLSPIEGYAPLDSVGLEHQRAKAEKDKLNKIKESTPLRLGDIDILPEDLSEIL